MAGPAISTGPTWAQTVQDEVSLSSLHSPRRRRLSAVPPVLTLPTVVTTLVTCILLASVSSEYAQAGLQFGESGRSEWVRYDPKSGKFIPYLPGIVGEGLDFSRDGDWVAFVSLPDGALWRSRVDGKERLQLTSPPMRAALPRWSPDGKQIAFMATELGRPWKIFVVTNDGGIPRQLMPGENDQADPSWSPGANSLAFGAVLGKGPLGIHLIDLKTGEASTLPSSEKLFSPRWSPDGRYLAAMPADDPGIRVFDFKAQRWTEVTKLHAAYPNWSHDGQHLYFESPSTEDAAFYRVRIRDQKLERVVSLKEMLRVTWGTFGLWSGLAPDDSPLVLRMATGTGEVPAASRLERGYALLRLRRYEEAVKAFRQSGGAGKNPSTEALWGLAQAYFGLRAHKNVVETCERILENASNDKAVSAQVHNLKAISLTALAAGKNLKRMKEAEAELRKALELSTDLWVVHFNLGTLLLQAGRDQEGIQELKAYLAFVPTGEAADRSRSFIENPRRARENFAPDFSLTSLQAEYIASEDLRGKVVLVDFWGTWCAPCVEAVPALARLHKRFSKEQFMVLSVSSDHDEQKWREFIDKYGMDWPQYLDRDGKLQRAFGVGAWPTYILIDEEGIIRYQLTGWGTAHEANLEDQVRNTLKALAKKAR